MQATLTDIPADVTYNLMKLLKDKGDNKLTLGGFCAETGVNKNDIPLSMSRNGESIFSQGYDMISENHGELTYLGRNFDEFLFKVISSRYGVLIRRGGKEIRLFKDPEQDSEILRDGDRLFFGDIVERRYYDPVIFRQTQDEQEIQECERTLIGVLE
ncbi:MAG: hypothetical protein ACE5ES_03035 [Candidatus Nanoarchaeia archaeon]